MMVGPLDSGSSSHDVVPAAIAAMMLDSRAGLTTWQVRVRPPPLAAASDGVSVPGVRLTSQRGIG